MADEAWDYWICLGDLLDNDAISQHNVGKPRLVAAAPTVLESFDYANKWLDRHLRILHKKSPKAKKVLIEGNHEWRTERYADKNPELAGLVNVPRALHLKSREIEWVPFWSRGETYRVGKLHFAHGRFTIQHHAAKHVRDFGCCVVYGHTHDIQCFPVKKRGNQHNIAAWSMGCLCEYAQAYMQGRPHNWQHAFGVVCFFPDGAFQVMQIPITRHQFVGPTNGRVYRG